MTDMETCSWCTDEVPDATLAEQEDGARLCRGCVRAIRNGTVHDLMAALRA